MQMRLGHARGPVAEWLEPTANNGLVAGSSPAGPTVKVECKRVNHKALISTIGTLMEAINATSQAHLRQLEGDQEAAAACLTLAQDALGRGVLAYKRFAESCPTEDGEQR